jgi:hypothetical protein
LPADFADFRIEMKRITVFDVILISAVLFLSIGILVDEKCFRAASTPVRAEAVVYCDGQELQRIDLRRDIEIALPGNKMVLAVEGGKIRVKGSDCDRQTCVHAGSIRFPGESIICVPNKTVVEVATGGTAGVDAVAF